MRLQSESSIKKFLLAMHNEPRISFDTETTSDSDTVEDNTHHMRARMELFAISWGKGEDIKENYIVWDDMTESCKAALSQLILSRSVRITGYNLKHDIKMICRHLGVHPKQVTYGAGFGDDAYIMFRLADENVRNSGLSACAKWLGLGDMKYCIFKTMSDAERKKLKASNREEWLSLLGRHCEEDVHYTQKCFYMLKPILKKEGVWKWYRSTELKNAYIWSKHEFDGFPVREDILIEARNFYIKNAIECMKKLKAHGKDTTYEALAIKKIKKKLGKEYKSMDEITDTEELKYIANSGTFNPNSSKQITPVIWSEVDEVPRRFLSKKTKKPSTGKKALEFLEKQGGTFITLLSAYRGWVQMAGHASRIQKECVNGIFYQDFDTCGTVTLRYTSSFHNIPRKHPEAWRIRSAFIIDSVDVDYAAVELRLMASDAEEESLIKCFKNPPDKPEGDPHKLTAEIIAAQQGIEYTPALRDKAKTANFGAAYGKTGDTEEEKEIIKLFFEAYPSIRNRIDRLCGSWVHNEQGYPAFKKRHGELFRDGYVTTLSGRKRRFPEYRQIFEDMRGCHDRKERNRLIFSACRIERQCYNVKMQGSCIDIMKRAIVLIDKYEPESKLLLQIHDELFIGVPKGMYGKNIYLKRIKAIMEAPFKKDLLVPLIAEPKFCKSLDKAKG